MLNCAYAQYSPLIWHEPRSFIPERFDPESKYFSMPSTDGSKKMRHPKSFSPFTFGMRNCAGQTLAKLKAKVILSRILQKIDYEIDDRFIKNTFIKFDMMSPEVLNGKILKFK